MKKEVIAALAAAFVLDSLLLLIIDSIQFSIITHIMEWFSHLMTVVFLLVVIGCYMLIQKHKKKYAVILLTSFMTAFAVSIIIKLIVMRLRPLGYEYIAVLIGDMLLHIPDYSFPSTHTAIAFSVLPILDEQFRNIKMLWIFIAVMIGLSRLYLSMHFLSDVVAGAILGYAVGKLFMYIEKHHGIAKRIVGP